MNISLHPGIGELDPNSLCHNLYTQLYNNFFHAQVKKDAEHPYGIEEGDEISIRLRNTAYNFADAISGAIGGNGDGEGGILLDYLKKTGGILSGPLTANYGFEAGINNHKLLETYYIKQTDINGGILSENYGIRFTGDVEIGAENLYIGRQKILSFDAINKASVVKGESIILDSGLITTSGKLMVSDSSGLNVEIRSDGISIDGNAVYHAGNANRTETDWTMHDGHIHGNLYVKVDARIEGFLKSVNGFGLGNGNRILISSDENGSVKFDSDLSFSEGYGIQMDGIPVLTRVNKYDIQIGSIGRDLLIGNSKTEKIRLLSNLTDIDGQYVLISQYGAAYFPDSLTVRHNHGKTVLSTYGYENDEGVIIHEKIRFGSNNGVYLKGDETSIWFGSSFVLFSDGGKRNHFTHITSIAHEPSISKYKPLDRLSNTLFIKTDTDFFSFNKPLEAQDYIGVNQSATKLADGILFFSDNKFFLSATDGIKHYGNAYFLNDVSSERFSSGFAGSGWAVMQNKVTGNYSATFDELTVRKKMRVYELEIQKISATNGSLWVSDNCQGDTVIKIL